MTWFGKRDAADVAAETFGTAEHEELVVKAALYVEAARQRAGRSARPEEVSEIALAVVADFFEGRPRIEVERGVRGSDLAVAIFRGLAGCLEEAAGG